VKVLGIVPARYASTRFPGKSLARTSAALKGRNNPAQGRALGHEAINRPSPEGAK